MVLEACAFSFIYNFVLYRRLYITRKDYQDHNHCLCKCSQIIKSWKLLCSKYRLKVSLFYLFFHCGKFLNLENVCRTGHGSCIFPGRYETRFLSLITLYFFFCLFTCRSCLILCSKKVGNRTQTVVNSTQVAGSEASSRSLSRGFCVSIMILVTCILLPF